MRDIELLLEDEWKDVYCPEDVNAFGKTIGEHPAAYTWVEYGAYQGSEAKLLDLNLPKGTEKLLVTSSVWRIRSHGKGHSTWWPAVE